jgi:hypothetical protein
MSLIVSSPLKPPPAFREAARGRFDAAIAVTSHTEWSVVIVREFAPPSPVSAGGGALRNRRGGIGDGNRFRRRLAVTNELCGRMVL